jgi:regulator of nonsense transcripts 3
MLIILFCFVDATSGGTSGSGQAGEAKRDKIVILKGRGRVDSNVS